MLLVWGSERQYHVPPICSELFQCAVLIFSFGAKCELGGCALLVWLHILPACCHQFNDTICICTAFSHIMLLTNVKIVPWTWFILGVSYYFKIVPKYMNPCNQRVGDSITLAASVYVYYIYDVFIKVVFVLYITQKNHIPTNGTLVEAINHSSHNRSPTESNLPTGPWIPGQ